MLRIVFSQLKETQNIEKCQKLLIEAANPPKAKPSNKELVGEFTSFCFEFVKMQATLQALQQVLPQEKRTSLDEAVQNCAVLLKGIKSALSEEQKGELDSLLAQMQKPENYRYLMGTQIEQAGVTPPNYKDTFKTILGKAKDPQELAASVQPSVVADINKALATQFLGLSTFSADTAATPKDLRDLGESLATGKSEDKEPTTLITSRLSVLMTQFMTRQTDTASAVLKNVADPSKRGVLVDGILSATQRAAEMNA